MIAATGQLTVMRELPASASRYEVARLLNTLLPDLVILDLSGGHGSLDSLALVREVAPQTPVIGLGCTPEVSLLAKHLGAAGLASSDSSPEDLRMMIRKAMEMQDGQVEPHLYTFLPSKAGSGCSTVVLHTAIAAAGLDRRVLVIDADLRSSVMGLMLGVTPAGGTQEVLQASAGLDTFVMRRNLVEKHGVDFLLSTRALDAGLPDWDNYFHLLNFVRGHYDLILVDLPELINPATVEVVRRSKKIFPVCTPELPSLKLMQQRLTELDRLGVETDRIGVLVNRTGRNTPSPEEFRQALGRTVAFMFPNDYPAVSASISGGAPLAPETALARAFSAFAATLAGVEPPPAEASLLSRLKGLLHLASA